MGYKPWSIGPRSPCIPSLSGIFDSRRKDLCTSRWGKGSARAPRDQEESDSHRFHSGIHSRDHRTCRRIPRLLSPAVSRRDGRDCSDIPEGSRNPWRTSLCSSPRLLDRSVSANCIQTMMARRLFYPAVVPDSWLRERHAMTIRSISPVIRAQLHADLQRWRTRSPMGSCLRFRTCRCNMSQMMPTDTCPGRCREDLRIVAGRIASKARAGTPCPCCRSTSLGSRYLSCIALCNTLLCRLCKGRLCIRIRNLRQ